MKVIKNSHFYGPNDKPIVFDQFYIENGTPKPVVIFAHGLKGFKDWGTFDIAAEAFANAGFYFVKFNFSHNGGTIEQPIDFPDLEAFGENNFTKELTDINAMINWVMSNQTKDMNTDQLSLVGHSRGGGIVLLAAGENEAVKKVVTWASVCDYKSRMERSDMQKWKEDGVLYMENGRTKQMMPFNYQFYQDFLENEDRLTISSAVKKMKQDLLIIHGTGDETVDVQEAYLLKEWKPDAMFEIIEGASHTFGASHPWEEKEMPTDMENTVGMSISFLNSQ